MERRERDALDRHITGNYGEDQFKEVEMIQGYRSHTLDVLLQPSAFWRQGLNRREQTFIENFTMSAEAGDHWWKANLEGDLRLYRYPHTPQVRKAVAHIMGKLYADLRARGYGDDPVED